MVDALSRIRGLLRAPEGRLIDIHPTADAAHLEVRLPGGTISVGDVEDDAGDCTPQRRHADADRAVATALARGWFVVEESREFTFLTHASTPAEMREHMSVKSKHSWLGSETLQRAAALLEMHTGADLYLREQVHIARLKPMAEEPGRKRKEPL